MCFGWSKCRPSRPDNFCFLDCYTCVWQHGRISYNTKDISRLKDVLKSSLNLNTGSPGSFLLELISYMSNLRLKKNCTFAVQWGRTFGVLPLNAWKWQHSRISGNTEDISILKNVLKSSFDSDTQSPGSFLYKLPSYLRNLGLKMHCFTISTKPDIFALTTSYRHVTTRPYLRQ